MQLTHIAKVLKDFLGDLYNPFFQVVKGIGIIVLSIIAVKLGSFVIRKIFQKQKSFRYAVDVKKIDTMTTLLLSIYRYIVYLIGAVIILSDVFQLKSVLAAAGIGGIALGLGAQSLIKDIISGFFIVMEDQFAVGDMITVDAMTGTVEELELRVTKLRDFNGDLYIIPNGEIKKLTNHTRGNKAVIVDIPLAYSADIGRAFETASQVCGAVGGEFNTIIETPTVLGVTDMGKEGLNIRIMARTLPNAQWEVERRIRFMVKEAFSREGLEFYDRNKIVTGDIPGKGGNKNG